MTLNLAAFPVTFLWPQFLWLLGLLPLMVLLYWWLLRRRRPAALRLPNLAIVREAMGKGPGWRRHVPPLLLLLAFAAMLLASARPLATITLPTSEQTVILAMDVSGSMRAADVEPNRLVASQNAAKAFLADLPRDVKVGIVAFAGTAQVVQPVTLNRDDLAAAIDKFQLQRATAIGSAIVVAASISTVPLSPRVRITCSPVPRLILPAPRLVLVGTVKTKSNPPRALTSAEPSSRALPIGSVS